MYSTIKQTKRILFIMSHQQDNQYRVFSLAEFKKYREEISNNICPRLMQIFQECANHELATDSLITEIEKLRQKLQDQHFRVAFIGEFNTGKSTLINALIGENIQPVKAIASSSTITVLKHGEQQRIICGYKNGSEKEISLNEYQDLTTIPTEIVLQHRSNELANSNIDQIIFEHPHLEFCNNGVVLVDSPGLNEHPNRTAITQKLLENIDAVIFLTIALQALSETERDFLVRDIITQLNNGEKNQPANNLFLVVNKIDVLDCEKDRQDVSKLVEEFAYGKNPIIVGKNRLHFISAKEAIRAFTNTTENEYSKTFNYFTKSLEEFLISERGVVEINNCATKIRNKYIKTCLEIFEEKCEAINLKIKDSETKKHRLIEQIDKLRKAKVRIRTVAEELMKEMIEKVESEVKKSWSDWVKANWWESQLSENSKNWKSEKNIIPNFKGVFEDYSKQFTEDLIKEIEKFITLNINDKINSGCEILDVKLKKEIENFISDCDGLYPILKYEDKSNAFNTDKFGSSVVVMPNY
jgi:ribosome biogenesis GTPase A